jgi:hypothetical protein
VGSECGSEKEGKKPEGTGVPWGGVSGIINVDHGMLARHEPAEAPEAQDGDSAACRPPANPNIDGIAMGHGCGSRPAGVCTQSAFSRTPMGPCLSLAAGWTPQRPDNTPNRPREEAIRGARPPARKRSARCGYPGRGGSASCCACSKRFQGTANQKRQREIWICTGFSWWHLERPVPGVTLIFGFFGEA